MELKEIFYWLFSALAGILFLAGLVLSFNSSVYKMRERKKFSYILFSLAALMYVFSMAINEPAKFPTALTTFFCLIPFVFVFYFIDEHIFGMTAGERRKIRDWLQSWFYGDDK